MIVTTRHVFSVPGFSKRPGFCRSGTRAWFKAHGLDWSAFVRNGIEEAALTATGDPFALATVKWAHTCAQRDAGGDA